MAETRLTLDVDVPGSPGAFITDMPDLNTVRTHSTITKATLSPRKLPTKLGIVGEIDVINGLLERMRAKTRKINPESPRTKQALTNLGIVKEECVIKKFSEFDANTKDEKMQKLLYIYYIGNVNDTIAQVLKERDRIRRKRRSSMEICAINSQQVLKIAPSTAMARTTFAVMDFDTKLDRLDANKQNEINLIERKAMNYLESERDYLKKLEQFNFKQDRAVRNKQKLDDKKGITERKEKYSESLGASQRLQAEQEEAAFRRFSNPHMLASPDKRVREEFQRVKLQRIADHKSKEMKALEERKKIETRIEQRNQEEMMRSTSALGQFLKKDYQSHLVLEKEHNKKQFTADKWKDKFHRAREHVKSAQLSAAPELYTRYGEKMRRFQNDIEKMEKEREKKQLEKKKLNEEQRQKVEENLQLIEKDFNLKEELLEEKLFNQTERLGRFYTARQRLWEQKADLNRFKYQRSQIHFDKVQANENRKCNIIMAKNKVSKEILEQRQMEKDKLRTTSMQNHWNVQGEKDSLNYYLDQVNKIHARNDLIAGRLKKVNTAFNVQHMASYIEKNFNTATSHHDAQLKEAKSNQL